MGKILIKNDAEDIYGESIEFTVKKESILEKRHRSSLSNKGWDLKDFFHKLAIVSRRPDGTVFKDLISPKTFYNILNYDARQKTDPQYDYVIDTEKPEVIADNNKYTFPAKPIYNTNLNIDLYISSISRLEDVLDKYLSNLNYSYSKEGEYNDYRIYSDYDLIKKFLLFMDLPMANFNFKTHGNLEHNILFIPKTIHTDSDSKIRKMEKIYYVDPKDKYNFICSIPVTFMVILSRSMLKIEELLYLYNLHANRRKELMKGLGSTSNLEGSGDLKALSTVSESMTKPLDIDPYADKTYLEVTLNVEFILYSKNNKEINEVRISLLDEEKGFDVIKGAIKKHVSQFTQDIEPIYNIIDNVELPPYLDMNMLAKTYVYQNPLKTLSSSLVEVVDNHVLWSRLDEKIANVTLDKPIKLNENSLKELNKL